MVHERYLLQSSGSLPLPTRIFLWKHACALVHRVDEVCSVRKRNKLQESVDYYVNFSFLNILLVIIAVQVCTRYTQ